jgi:hypothetical protein
MGIPEIFVLNHALCGWLLIVARDCYVYHGEFEPAIMGSKHYRFIPV